MSDEDSTETQREVFFVALGQSADTARLARLVLTLELSDGTTVEGVPVERAEAAPGESEIDHTGTRSHLELDGELVMLQRVRRYSLACSAATSSEPELRG